MLTEELGETDADGEALALTDELGDLDADTDAEGDTEAEGEAEAEGDWLLLAEALGDTDAEGERLALALALGDTDADGEVAYTLYPYDPARHRVDFSHEAGKLLPIEKLEIKDVISADAPQSPGEC